MRFALRFLICCASSECLDSPDFALPVVEVLDNYRTMIINTVSCEIQRTYRKPGSDCQRDWAWSPVAVGGLPLGDMEDMRSDSKWVTAGGGIYAVIRWLDLGIQNEAAFWGYWFDKVSTDGWLPQQQAEDWTHDDLCKILTDVATPRVLNVGSGPVVPNGLQCGEQSVPVISTDGLAHLFWRLYDSLDLTPPTLPTQCTFEQLTRCFPRGYFPLVHVRNSLDHAVDLHTSLLQLLAVTRRGGSVLLRHGRNEGAHMEYTGMHVWSFDVDVNFSPPHAIAIFGRERTWRFDLNEELEGIASIKTSVVSLQEASRSEGVITRDEYVFIDMTKL